MFRRKPKAQQAPPAQVQMPEQSGPRVGSNGYQVVELPTYHAGKRKVVVYTSDASGKIIKTFKK
jgi:hypothetical protein